MRTATLVRKLQKRLLERPKRQLLLIATALLFGSFGIYLLATSNALTPTASIEAENGTLSGSASIVTDSGASGGKAVRFGSGTTCTVNSILVDSCRPWLAATAYGYSGTTDFLSRITNHETRIGRQVDVAHDYLLVGTNSLSSSDVTLAKRANTILAIDWKPTDTWSSAAGGNSTVNSAIDTLAASIKSLGSTKVMLSIYHEPEDNVSAGGSPTCGSSYNYKGSSGTTADYVNMWHNVRARFDADGVTNVVWYMNYMGFSSYDCMVKDLWPGNSYVDWVTWDPYATTNTDTFSSVISNFYNVLTTDTDSTHAFTSKPWGLSEWGAFPSVDQTHVYALYDAAKSAVDNNTYPNLKMYTIFDDAVNGQDDRIDFTSAGVQDDTEQSHYIGFSSDPRFTDSYY